MGISWELLSKSQGSGILSVSSADLDDICEFLWFFFKLSMQSSKSRQKNSVGFENCCDMHDSGEAIITRLTSVDMIIRMDRFFSNFSAKNLCWSVGNDLIGVHVWLSSWTSLPNNKREVSIKLSWNHLIRSFNDGIRYSLLEAIANIDFSTAFFKDAESADNGYWHAISVSGNIEVLNRSLSLSCPVTIGRYLNGSESVSFLSEFREERSVDLKERGDFVDSSNHKISLWITLSTNNFIIKSKSQSHLYFYSCW